LGKTQIIFIFIYLIHFLLKQNIFIMAAIEATQATFSELISSSQPVLVDFWAEWCGPCQMMTPIVHELSDEFAGKAKIAKVDVDSNSELTVKYGVRNIPTILIFKDGEIVEKIVGTTTKIELKNRIDKLVQQS
jgi:thioredoxin 1